MSKRKSGPGRQEADGFVQHSLGMKLIFDLRRIESYVDGPLDHFRMNYRSDDGRRLRSLAYRNDRDAL